MKNFGEISGREPIPRWVRPDLQKERGEIERAVREFSGEEPNVENVQRVFDALKNAPMVELSDEMWAALDNTDSFHNIIPGHIEEARQITETYNQELPPQNRRDFGAILNGFKGGAMEAPVIIKNKEGALHLVSGNTRLMIARSLGVKPDVIVAEIG